MMLNNKSGSIGNYTMHIKSKKVKEIISDKLPILGGIKIYPMRFGIYKKDHTPEELHSMYIEATSIDAVCISGKKPYDLTANYNTSIPDFDDKKIYEFFPMPLRDGWLYAVSSKMDGIYEYQHSDYKYKLYALYSGKETTLFPSNTTRQPYLNFDVKDKVYLFYSDVRLEPTFLRQRFFKGSALQLKYNFDVEKWLDKNSTDYKSDMKYGRLAAQEAYMAMVTENGDNDFAPILENLAKSIDSDIKKRNPRNIGMNDVFVAVEDVIGIAQQISNDIKYWNLQHDALLRSLRTGIPQKEIFDKISTHSLSDIGKNIIPTDDELFNLDDKAKEIGYMNTMAVLMKTFFFDKQHDKSIPKEMQYYFYNGRKSINQQTLYGILGVEQRKYLIDEITFRRMALYKLIESDMFRNYALFFLDKSDFQKPITNESDLAYLVPDAYPFDDIKDTAIYSCMLNKQKYIMAELVEAISTSPTTNDASMAGTWQDPMREYVAKLQGTDIKKDETDRRPPFYIIFILLKECLTSDYFEDGILGKVTSFFEENVTLDWSMTSSGITILSTLTNYYLAQRTISADITFNLNPNEWGEFKEVEKNPNKIHNSVVISRDKGSDRIKKVQIYTSDVQGDLYKLQYEWKPGANSKMWSKQRGNFTFVEIEDLKADKYKFAEDKVILSDILVAPKASWKGVQENGLLGRYLTTKFAQMVNAVFSHPLFGPFSIFLNVKILSKSLQEHEDEPIRQITDTGIAVAGLAACTELFLSEKNLQSWVKNPFYKLNKLNPDFKFSRVTTVSVVFRGIAVLGNILEGFNAIFEGNKLVNNGNYIVGISFYIIGTFMGFFSLLAFFGVIGWTGYLLIVVALVIAEIVLPMFADKPLVLFLESTVFREGSKYPLLQLPQGMEGVQQIYRRLENMYIADRKIKREKTVEGIVGFANQVDELVMIHLFTPSVNECNIRFKYPDTLYNSNIKPPIIYSFPNSFTFTFNINLGPLLGNVDALDLSFYRHEDKDAPSEALIPLASTGNIQKGIVYVNSKEISDKNPLSFTLPKDTIIYKEGSLHFEYSVSDPLYPEPKYSSQLKTYPFFKDDHYFLFIYLRFRTAGHWLPSDRKGQPAFLVCRYRVEKGTDYRRQGNPLTFSIEHEESKITNFTRVKNLK